MNILVVNDDGIHAKGIHHLAKLAKSFGKVTVVSPLHQCSGMSHSISFEKDVFVRKAAFPVPNVEAFSVTGTPADCAKIGINLICKEKPDVVFSGINKGYNIGYEALYSGTVGAAMEALTYEVPAIAFSQENFEDFSAYDTYFKEIVEKLLKSEITSNQIWNVNFPDCTSEEIQGIDYDCLPEKDWFYHDHFELEQIGDLMYQVNSFYGKKKLATEGTDMNSLLHNRIAIGKLTSRV